MDGSLPPTAPLTTFPDGEAVRICQIGVPGREARRLRGRGLHKGCEGCVWSKADACVLGLDTCVFSLQRDVAAQILARPVPTLTRLSDLSPGQGGPLRRYATADPPRRLLEMGLVPDTPVQLVRRAPLGDPLYLNVRGQALSIRTRHARLIHIHTA